MKHLVLLVALCTLLQGAHAEVKKEEYVVRGAGMWTCQKFLEQQKSTPEVTENLFFVWAQGFLSGFNMARDEYHRRDINSLSNKDQQNFIRRLCEDKPNVPYFGAVMKLYDNMKPVGNNGQ